MRLRKNRRLEDEFTSRVSLNVVAVFVKVAMLVGMLHFAWTLRFDGYVLYRSTLAGDAVVGSTCNDATVSSFLVADPLSQRMLWLLSFKLARHFPRLNFFRDLVQGTSNPRP